MQIVLTDDELVAVAVRNDSIWSSPLPSLVDAEGGELKAAVARGWRSLAVRQFGRGDDTGSDLQEALRPALEQRVELRTFLATESGDISAAGSVLSCYSEDERTWLLEIASPDGVHHFSSITPAAARQLITEAAQGAYTAGLEQPADWPADWTVPTLFCVVAHRDGEPAIALVGQGQVRVMSSAEPTPVVVADVEAALRQLGLAGDSP